MFKLIALESFDAAEDGLHTKHYAKGEKLKVIDKKFMDLLVLKKHAKLDDGLETKVVEPEETKTAKKVAKATEETKK